MRRRAGPPPSAGPAQATSSCASLARVWQPEALQQAVRAVPLWAQFLAILLLSDLVQYWVHRAFHVVPALWRLHAVHHSSTVMDWLAGSRLHVFDVLVTRGLVLAPICLLGFATEALYAYLVFVSFHALFFLLRDGRAYAEVVRSIPLSASASMPRGSNRPPTTSRPCACARC